MSAHCDECGADLVYGTGEDWQLMTCPRCEIEKERDTLAAEVAALRADLTEMEADRDRLIRTIHGRIMKAERLRADHTADLKEVEEYWRRETERADRAEDALEALAETLREADAALLLVMYSEADTVSPEAVDAVNAAHERIAALAVPSVDAPAERCEAVEDFGGYAPSIRCDRPAGHEGQHEAGTHDHAWGPPEPLPYAGLDVSGIKTPHGETG